MIVERLVFHAKYGKGDALVDLFKRTRPMFEQAGSSMGRILVDYTGTMFRVIVETEHADASAWAKADAAGMEIPGFEAFFREMEPLIERGERELLRVVG
ncbi:MAG: hypothetical protein ACR2HN_12700 [Tepidiformaceae bacterium]